MDKTELQKYKIIYEKERDNRDEQVSEIMQKITDLRFEIEKQGNRDMIKEIYDKNNISSENITLQEFRQLMYSKL